MCNINRIHLFLCFTSSWLSRCRCSFSPVQVLLGPVRSEREAQAAADPHDLHELAAEGARARVRGDALPGHLHARGARAEDRPDGGARAGEAHHWSAKPYENIRVWIVIYIGYLGPLSDVIHLDSGCFGHLYKCMR